MVSSVSDRLSSLGGGRSVFHFSSQPASKPVIHNQLTVNLAAMVTQTALESALASGDVASALSSLQVLLRSAYATGRSSRAALRSVLALLSNADAPPALKVLGYEILWTLTAATDAGGYGALLAIARKDAFSADHPDMSLAALATLSSIPAPLALEALLVDDAERSMCDAIGGEAPPHVRAASISTFARLATAAWLQAAEPAASGGRGGAGATSPAGASERTKALIFDRAADVFKAVVAAAEDANNTVVAAAWNALRTLLESGPHAPLDDGNCLRALPRGIAPDSLLGDAVLHGGAGRVADAGEAWAALPSRAALSKLLREVVRRIAARLVPLAVRARTLRGSARAAAARTLTLVHAHALAEVYSRAGGASSTSVIRSDSGLETTSLSAARDFCMEWLMPTAARGDAGDGDGGAAALEAARCLMQLICTFAARPRAATARSAAASAAASDL